MVKKMVSRGNPENLYVQLYRILRGLIESGEWSIGGLIPPEKELCKTYSVSAATVKTAISHLVKQGLLVRWQGRGTFVENWQQLQSEDSKMEGRLIEGISHELNNVLAVIGEKAGWLEELIEEEDKDSVKHYAEYRDAVKKISLQISRGRKVTHRNSDLPLKIEEIKKRRNNGGK